MAKAKESKYKAEYVCLFIPSVPDKWARDDYNAKYMKKHGLTKENSTEYDWGLAADGFTATTTWVKKAGAPA